MYIGDVCKLINFRLPLCGYIFTDKYLNVKVVNCGENRVCGGGKCICTSALITVPSLNQFYLFLVHL